MVSRVSVDVILAAVAAESGVPVLDLVGGRRVHPIVDARHIAVYCIRYLNGDSWQFIAEQVGVTDHTSAMHGFRKVLADVSLRRRARRVIALVLGKD